jgi:hypothetical protein
MYEKESILLIMNLLITLLTICIVIFLYLHIIYQLKTSDDLEIYEIELPNKTRLEEVCELRQPILFYYPVQMNINDYTAFDINIKENQSTVPLLFSKAIELFEKDNEHKFYTENNETFLDDTTLKKSYEANDELLRPYMIASKQYDFISGSNDSIIPLRYNNYYRDYFIVVNGSITVKLTPPKNSKYLYKIVNYETGEYKSEINPWNPDEKHLSMYNKVKFLEIKVNQGQLIYIPSYWWFSIKLENQAQLCRFSYRTYMNYISILPDVVRGILQRNNIKIKSIPSITDKI